MPFDESVNCNVFPDNPSGVAIDVSNIFIVFVVLFGIEEGSAVECVLIDNVIVLVPVLVPLVYIWGSLAPWVPPATDVLDIELELPSPQLIKNVATTSLAFVVSLST